MMHLSNSGKARSRIQITHEAVYVEFLVPDTHSWVHKTFAKFVWWYFKWLYYLHCSRTTICDSYPAGFVSHKNIFGPLCSFFCIQVVEECYGREEEKKTEE